MAEHSGFLLTVSGIAFFMFGMQTASGALQKLTANRTRDLMKLLSRRKIYGFFAGIGLTVMLQSSGAVSSLLVGLASASVIRLREVIPVLMGSAVGATITVQLLSLNIAQYGLAIFACSFIIRFLSQKDAVKKLMLVFIGFGLLFFGLELIKLGTDSLRNIETFAEALKSLNQDRLIAIGVVALITAIVHSSTVTIGFAMTLTGAGLMSASDAFLWVYGANIGTTAVAIIASLGESTTGKQVAWSHFLFKLTAVILVFPATETLAGLLYSSNLERSVANFHTFYNVATALLLLPISNLIARVTEIIVPNSKAEKEFSVKYLEKYSWTSSSLPVALAHAEREVLRMSNIVTKMIGNSLDLFKNYNPELADKVGKQDDKVDLLYREIRVFLTEKLDWSQESDNIDQSEIIRILNYTSDLESVADVIDNSMKEMAAKKHSLKLEFTDEGWEELHQIHQNIIHLNDYSVGCFQRRDRELAAKVTYLKREIRKLETSFKEAHISRLLDGRKESSKASSIHMDLLGEFRRISGLLSNHVYQEFFSTDTYNILPRKIESTESQ